MGTRFLYSLAYGLILSAGLGGGIRASAQPNLNEKADTIRGTVVNRVTHTPIARALVTSADQRLAVLTDSEGRFEFTVPQNSTADGQENIVYPSTYLFARKPGYLSDSHPRTNYAAKELTLTLIPEALIVGKVNLPTAEPAEGIFVELYRRQIQDGFARWMVAGGAQSRSDGEFRFAELPAGAYKLVTRESIDRDPLSADPQGQLYGYPPVYAQNAPDFHSASTIQVSAGMTSVVNISVARKPYYSIHIPVASALADGNTNFAVQVRGPQGPGFSLGYNPRTQAVEGMLPDGSYTIEASGFGTGQALKTGLVSITVKGAAVRGPTLTPVSNASIRVDVDEEFTSTDNSGSITFNLRQRAVQLKGPRRYLNVTLESAEDSERGSVAGLRNPVGPKDESLVIENARPGRYWVRVSTTRGYAASVRSGGIDLLHEPLVIGPGASIAPIEITMRDDQATIAGTVEGATLAQVPARSASQGKSGVTFGFSEPMLEAMSAPSVYFVPLADSSAQYAETQLLPNGAFSSPPLAPGAYRILAFDRPQTELEYRSPEAMRTYEGKGPVVQVSGGQREQVRLQVISSSE